MELKGESGELTIYSPKICGWCGCVACKHCHEHFEHKRKNMDKVGDPKVCGYCGLPDCPFCDEFFERCRACPPNENDQCAGASGPVADSGTAAHIQSLNEKVLFLEALVDKLLKKNNLSKNV